jgi:hypothetical protein
VSEAVATSWGKAAGKTLSELKPGGIDDLGGKEHEAKSPADGLHYNGKGVLKVMEAGIAVGEVVVAASVVKQFQDDDAGLWRPGDLWCSRSYGPPPKGAPPPVPGGRDGNNTPTHNDGYFLMMVIGLRVGAFLAMLAPRASRRLPP